MKRIFLTVLLIFLILSVSLFGYLFVGKSPKAENIGWGVNFSQKQAGDLGTDWREVYLALLDDLGARKIKLATYWSLIESSEGKYNFDDLDWQIEEARKRDAKMILVVGMKTPRWPECHVPDWAKNMPKKSQQEKVLAFLKETVNRYKGNQTIWAWQVENEPFFPFGECPWKDKNFLKKEINLVKSLDSQKRPVIVSETGEFSLWLKTARLADIVGVTMYRGAWFEFFNAYIQYPFPPVFYWRKAQAVEKLFNKSVICVELQAEPWGSKLLQDVSLEEQQKTMDLRKFKENIDFARNTGLSEFYLWGAEWWYWLKEKQNQPEIWNEAEKLF